MTTKFIRNLIFFLFIFFPFHVSSQNKTHETFKDFSYLLYGFKFIQKEYYQSQGTGFFIKTDTAAYFITANHVVNGCVNGIKDSIQPDFMMVWRNATEHYKEWHFNLNTKSIRDTSICRPTEFYPDIFIYKIANLDTLKININFINSFIDGPSNKPNEELIFYGFPSVNRNDLENVFDQKASIFKSKYFHVRNTSKNLLTKNNINLKIDIKDQVVDSTIKGFSGSPVFIKEYKTDKILFVGILSSVDLKSNSLYIIKPKYIFDMINYVPKYLK